MRSATLRAVFLVSLISIITLSFVFFELVMPFSTKQFVTVTVTDKDRVVYSSGSGDSQSVSSKYLVWTTDERGAVEVFENTDVLILGKFNSSDFQGQLVVGDVCDLEVYGYRIPFLSWYRNISKIMVCYSP